MDTLWYISERAYMWFMYLSCIGSNCVAYAVVVAAIAIGITLPLHTGFQHACEYVPRERRQRWELIFSAVVLCTGIVVVVYFGLPEMLFPFEFFDEPCERFDPDKSPSPWKV